MGAKCLVTASREGAKIFSVEKGKLEFIKKFENPDGTARNREFTTEKPGPKGGAYDPKTDIEIAFTKFLAKTLPLEVSDFTDVVIAAEPRFQGFLKIEMKRHSPQTTVRWLSEDWNHLPSSKIETLLKN